MSCIHANFPRWTLGCILLLNIVVGTSRLYADGETIWIKPNNSDIKFGFWPSGYSDGWYWGYDDRHNYEHHEMLSGEWAAAIHYDGIASGSSTMWLTRNFVFPDFTTNSNFSTVGDPNQWDNPANPVGGTDSAYAIIQDEPNKVQIRIDWELVDLGEGTYSPLGLIDANGLPRFVKSTRYVILQTYTIKNISASTITGLKFFQLLHGHPADSYGATNSGSYTTASYGDALASYTPYNPVHQVGDFRYDMTQWNAPSYQGDEHIDYMAFSSTVAPSSYEVGFFPHQFPPTSGTYVRVMNRSLNGQTFLADQEIAGAMGWDLGTLTPGQSKSLTLAVMFASDNWNYPTLLTKANADPNNDPVQPFIGMGIEDNYLTYNVTYDANGYALQSAFLTDYLPQEVDFHSCTGGGTYDANDREISWALGDLSANAAGGFQVVTKVNYWAKPGGWFRNNVLLQSTEGQIVDAICDVNVACWTGGERAYVDPNATGFGNGTSWADAYTSLDDALDAAGRCGVTEIWLKQGVYRPRPASYIADSTFRIPSGAVIYGGFCGTEVSPAQRIFDPIHPSLVTGDMDGDGATDASRAMTISNVVGVVVDGLTFVAESQGLYVSLADPCVTNCRFVSNSTGIRAENYSWPAITACSFSNNSIGIDLYYASAEITACDIGPGNGTGINCYDNWTDVKNCLIHDNGTGIRSQWGAVTYLTSCSLEQNGQAVYVSNYADIDMDRSIVAASSYEGILAESSSTAVVTNSIVRDNGSHGIRCSATNDMIVTNNWIVGNGTSGGYGIYIENIISNPTIRNNTIADNGSGGIYRSGNMYPPNVLNCIFWQNGAGGTVDTVGTFGNITYCRTSASGGTGNIAADPCFVDPCNGDYHIRWESACVDAGQTVYDCYWEPDIDQEDRVFDGDGDGTATVDMGADECYKSPADLDDDDIVNFIDYALFIQRWLWSSCNAGNEWCYGADIDRSTAVNWQDLRLFVKDWLWQSDYPQLPGAPAYLFGEPDAMMMSMPGGDSLEMAEASFDKSAESLESSSVAMAAAQPEPVDIEDLIEWAWSVWKDDPELRTEFTETQWQQFIDDLTELCKAEQ